MAQQAHQLHTPCLGQPQLVAPTIPPLNIEPIRSVGPSGHVVAPRTGLAAGEGEQLPRGGLCDAQWRQPEFRRVYPDHKLACSCPCLGGLSATGMALKQLVPMHAARCQAEKPCTLAHVQSKQPLCCLKAVLRDKTLPLEQMCNLSTCPLEIIP